MGINLLSLPKEIVLRHPFLEYISAIKLIEQKEIFDAGHLLQVSANSGYIKSQEKLLDIYKGLCGLPENPQLYFKYAEKAMLQNSPKATYALALCYVNGYGTQQSTSAGIMMIDKAVELGYSEAIRIKSLLNSL